MAFAPGIRASRLELAARAAEPYLLNERQAREIADHQIESIRAAWDEVADLAALTAQDRAFFKGRQFLNPYVFEDYSRASPWH